MTPGAEKFGEYGTNMPGREGGFKRMDFLNNAAFFEASGMITRFSRYALPVLAFTVLLRCAVSMLSGKPEREVWGWLSLPNGAKVELVNWENIVGRSASADVCLNYQSVSRTHAALTRDMLGRWTVQDLSSKNGTTLRGHPLKKPAAIHNGDIVSFGGAECVFTPSTVKDEKTQARTRHRPGARVHPGATLIFLTAFTLTLGVQHTAAAGEGAGIAIPAAFLALTALMWVCYAITRSLRRTGFEVETLAFFLTAVGFGVCASSDPEGLWTQLACLLIGVALYFFIGSWLRDLRRAKALRVPMAVVGILLLLVNLVTAKSLFGARNWIRIAGISFQPSELVKICFVFTGAATLDRLYQKRNLVSFVAFAAACVLCLAAMSDFGTAAIFFAAYIVIAFMRSGSFATVFLSLAGTGLGVFIVLTARPYVLSRFAVWGHAWEDAQGGGFQQTRTMAAAASGGLFGLGGGNGKLHRVFAADTDMAFGMVAEELGLIVALLAILALVLLALFAVRSSGQARSAFYAIGACAAVTILLSQLTLNVFGSVDLLPFTGVTFPLVSKGGSSMISVWGLLAFVKAADARQNASFAIALNRKKNRKKKKEGGERA